MINNIFLIETFWLFLLSIIYKNTRYYDWCSLKLHIIFYDINLLFIRFIWFFYETSFRNEFIFILFYQTWISLFCKLFSKQIWIQMKSFLELFWAKFERLLIIFFFIAILCLLCFEVFLKILIFTLCCSYFIDYYLFIRSSKIKNK